MDRLSTHLSIPVEEPRMSLRSLGAVFASCIAYFSNQYAISVVAVHLYKIGDNLRDAEYKVVIWFINGASLAVMLLGPAMAHYANVNTRKWILLSGLIFGLVGQLVSGLSKRMNNLIVGQTLVGVALASQPLMVTIPAEVLAQNKRRYAQIATNVAGALGGLSGAIAGGAILKHQRSSLDPFFWQWVFRIGAMLYGATFFLVAWTYKPRALQVCVNARQTQYPFDWTGNILLAMGIVPLMTGLTFGGEPSSWSGLRVLLPLIAGAINLFLFIIWEIWGVSTGLFHHRLFTHGRNFPIALSLFFVEGILFIVFLVWYNQQIYELYERNPLLQGLRFAVFYGAVTILAPFIAIICARTRTVKPALIIGNIFIALASALMASATLGSSRAVIAYALLAGIGLTAPLVTLMTAIHLCAPPDMIHAVAPLATMMRTFGIIAGNVLSDVVINTQFSALLHERLPIALRSFGLSQSLLDELAEAFETRLTSSVKNITTRESFSFNLQRAARGVADQAQLDSFRIVWIATATLAVIAVLSCFAMGPVNPLEAQKSAVPGTSSTALNDNGSQPYNLETPQQTQDVLVVNEKHTYHEAPIHKIG